MRSKLATYKYRLHKTLKSHQAFVVLLGVLLVLLVVFLRINSLNSLPIDQSRLNEESAKITPVQFNEEAIEQIKQLSESNVADPGTQLPGNRHNPFNE